MRHNLIMLLPARIVIVVFSLGLAFDAAAGAEKILQWAMDQWFEGNIFPCIFIFPVVVVLFYNFLKKDIDWNEWKGFLVRFLLGTTVIIFFFILGSQNKIGQLLGGGPTTLLAIIFIVGPGIWIISHPFLHPEKEHKKFKVEVPPPALDSTPPVLRKVSQFWATEKMVQFYCPHCGIYSELGDATIIEMRENFSGLATCPPPQGCNHQYEIPTIELVEKLRAEAGVEAHHQFNQQLRLHRQILRQYHLPLHHQFNQHTCQFTKSPEMTKSLAIMTERKSSIYSAQARYYPQTMLGRREWRSGNRCRKY